MQTLSLQTSQSAQKSLTDVANKSEANVDALASSSEKTPFQHELTKQVHAKKQSSQSVQARATLPQNKVAQGTQSPKNVQSKMDAEAMANALATEKQPVDIAKLSPADSVAMLLTLQPAAKVSDAGSLRESKDKKETEAEALAAINLENNVAALAGAQMMPAPVAPMFKYQNDAAALPEEQLAAASGDLNSPLTSVMPTAPQKSLDLILSNNLSQSKNLSAPVMEPDVADNMVAKLPLQTGRAEDVLGNMASKGTGVEVVANKLSSSVLNEAANKEMLTNKEAVTMQTAAIQSSIVSASSQSPVMQAANNLAAAQQLGSANTINAYPGKAGWDQAIGQKVVWMVGAGEQSATLTLNPPDLGPLKVVIHVHNDQADTTFISDNDEVRRALENGMSNLRDRMNESGVQLGQTNVSTSSQSQQGFQQSAQSRSAGQVQNQANVTQSESVASVRTNIRTGNGLVDTFA